MLPLAARFATGVGEKWWDVQSFLTVEKKQERNYGETMKMFAMGFLHGNYTRLTQKQ